MKNTIRIVIATLILGAVAGSAHARDHGSSLTREAHRVIDSTEKLTLEVHRHFRHAAGYRHLISDSAAIRRKAAHVDELSHRVHGIDDVRHLQDDLEELDGLVHHLGELVEDIGRGHSRGHGRGHAHGDTHHVEELVACINRSLHSMQRMVSEMERSCRQSSVRGHGRGHGGAYELRYARPPVGAPFARRVIHEVLRRR